MLGLKAEAVRGACMIQSAFMAKACRKKLAIDVVVIDHLEKTRTEN
jgi:hypothetical protein